jgi:hypothetical protein
LFSIISESFNTGWKSMRQLLAQGIQAVLVNPLADFYICVVPLCSKYTEGQYARQSPDRTLKQ